MPRNWDSAQKLSALARLVIKYLIHKHKHLKSILFLVIFSVEQRSIEFFSVKKYYGLYINCIKMTIKLKAELWVVHRTGSTAYSDLNYFNLITSPLSDWKFAVFVKLEKKQITHKMLFFSHWFQYVIWKMDFSYLLEKIIL